MAHAAIAGCAGWRGGGYTGSDGVLAMTQAGGRRCNDINLRDVVLRAGEAGCVVNGAGAEAGGGCLASVVLREDQEPC